MCPLYPFHIIILYLCLLLPLLLAVVQGAEELSGIKISNNRAFPTEINFDPEEVSKLQEQNYTEVKLTLTFDDQDPPDERSKNNLQLLLRTDDPNIASVSRNEDHGKEIFLNLSELPDEKVGNNWTWTFNISANFLGFAKVETVVKQNEETKVLPKVLPVSVVRKKTIQSKLFSYSVAILVSLAYINIGCALDLKVVKDTLKKPIGPMIGFICQYIFMPLIAFGLGFIFPAAEIFGQTSSTHAPMRLGLFVTGCSPGGGASNIWTVMFGGNLDLSVTMTAISTFAAFVMMPAWIFSLGQVIFHSDEDRAIIIPYYKICIYAFCLVIPLSIGFAFGCTLARLTKRPPEDVIAIAIETGVQNTGMAIFILWFTLDQPLGDMTAVVPVAAATMTPIPLLLGLLVKKITERFCSPEITSTSDQKVCGIIKGTNIPEKCNQPLENMQFEDTFKESESTQKLMINVESPPEEESPSRR